ncbi:amino acid dehydrogenase [Cupriavidus necator]|uniref:Amino acid dehydrogenase n=1 Tax=Cupriavidus necator TaxID=106590 RepID=A0A367PF21_CUPNE|nr:amino acid dehydrogenase [Cupriavidus necator]QQX88894.1 amino acid dehydrogenase [Cupriavidus necator]RCJ06462.1 amino acid dehydrogenase [Cupriavidus necator]
MEKTLNHRIHPEAAVRLFGTGEGLSHERITLATDPESGLQAIVAIYSTRLGPAFGGCRYWTYPSDTDALSDALRLSQGMAYKNALAGLPFGGGKAVILRTPDQADRRQLFRAFGRLVESLGGSYITAEDVGTTVEDMRAVQSETRYVSGMPRDAGFGGNPSPWTAYGVFVGIEAAVQYRLDRKSLAGVSVAVQGLGSVGWELCRRLHDAGATLIVTDIDDARTRQAQQQFGARVVSPEAIAGVESDVFAPCALGAVVTPAVAEGCRFRIIAGGANNQLSSLAEGDTLQKRGIFYAPDFLINAGGIISCAREYLGGVEAAALMEEVSRIRERVFSLARRVEATGEPPARAAVKWAQEVLRGELALAADTTIR